MSAVAVPFEPRRGFSIRIFLADGLAEGLWLVEKPNWTGLALAIPRSNYARVRDREEMTRAGVYVLLGPSEESGDTLRVYVGEADVLKPRLDSHHANKDFWTRAVVFTAKDNSLNKAHVRYLEARLVNLASLAQRAELDNGAQPQIPLLSEADTADMETFLEEMLLIYPVLDIRVFEKLTGLSEVLSTHESLFAEGPDGAKAEGRETSEGFVVFESSHARASQVQSIPPHVSELRKELVSNGVLQPQDGYLLFTQNYLFRSPSTAAGVVLGQSVNGRTAWKDSQGHTLKDIQSALVNTP